MIQRAVPIVYLVIAAVGGGLLFADRWAWLDAALLALLAVVCHTRAPRLWPLIVTSAAVAAYVAWARGSGSLLMLATAVAALIILVVVSSDRGWRLLAISVVTAPILAVGAILVRDAWMQQAHLLVALATGLAWAAGVMWVLWDHRPSATRSLQPKGVPVASPDTPVFARWPRLGTREQWHGWALILTAAMLPLGEGAAFAGGGMCLILLVVRRAAVAPASLLTGDSRKVVLAFAVWMGMALLAALLSGHGLVETREIGRIGPFVFVPLVFLSVASLPARWLDRALHAFVLVLALACVTAIAQYCLNLLRDHQLAESLIGLLMKGSQSRVPGTNDELVAGGFYRHRLKMAHVVLLGIAVLLGRQLFVPLRTQRRALEIGLLVLFFATLMLTFTRGAILGIGAAVAVAIWLGTPRWRLRAVIAVGLIAAAALSIPTIRQRVVSIGAGSTGSDRAFIWAQAVQIVSDHRLGIGLANYPTWAADYYEVARSPYNLPLTYPHNLVMGAWAEAGPAGLGGYVAMWLALAMVGVAGIRRRGDVRSLTAASALLLVAVAFWVVGITHDVLFHKPVALTFSTIVGACLAQLSREKS